MGRVICSLLGGGALIACATCAGRQPFAGPPSLVPRVTVTIADKSDDAAGKKLFRERIRPALKEHCYECHSAKSDELKGNLRLDSREGWLKGGDNGPAIVPGDVEKSFLLKTMSYREDDYKMPPRGKLDEELLGDFERWVKLGAQDDW